MIEIHTPLSGDFTFTEAMLDKMLEAIDKTHKERIEHGISFCVDDREIKPGELCSGTICSVEPTECPPNMRKIGEFHTHPEERADFSVGDYMGLLHMALDGKVGLGCVWGRIDNRFLCMAPRREITSEAYGKFMARYGEGISFFDDWEITGRQPTDGRRAELLRLTRDTEDYFLPVLETDRAGLAEALVKPRKLTIDECLTFYSHTQLAERARKAGISTEGGKRKICERLIEAGIL